MISGPFAKLSVPPNGEMKIAQLPSSPPPVSTVTGGGAPGASAAWAGPVAAPNVATSAPTTTATAPTRVLFMITLHTFAASREHSRPCGHRAPSGRYHYVYLF